MIFRLSCFAENMYEFEQIIVHSSKSTIQYKNIHKIIEPFFNL